MKFFRPLPVIKAVSFDLDDTLYDNYPVIMKAEKALGALLQAHYPKAAAYDRQTLNNIKKALIAKDKRLASDMGELRRRTLYRILRDDVTEDELDDAVEHCFTTFYRKRSEIEINRNVHSCLSELSKHVPLVAVTNGNVDTQAIDLDKYFQFSLHASLAFQRKPYPDMFVEASRRLKLAPQHILHVGDGFTNDIYGGYKAGFSTAWLAANRPMQLANEKIKVLPNIQLASLRQLIDIVN